MHIVMAFPLSFFLSGKGIDRGGSRTAPTILPWVRATEARQDLSCQDTSQPQTLGAFASPTFLRDKSRIMNARVLFVQDVYGWVFRMQEMEMISSSLNSSESKGDLSLSPILSFVNCTSYFSPTP
jgi:hypothetical protein